MSNPKPPRVKEEDKHISMKVKMSTYKNFDMLAVKSGLSLSRTLLRMVGLAMYVEKTQPQLFEEYFGKPEQK